MSDFLQPHGVQNARLPWPAPTSRACLLMSIESVMLSNHLILCGPLLLLPSILPSIRVFSNESVFYIRWPKYWSFSISPSNEYSGLISFRIDLCRQPVFLFAKSDYCIERKNENTLNKRRMHTGPATHTHTHKKRIHFQEKLVLVLPHILTSVLRLMAIVNPQISLGIGRYNFFPSLITIAL